MSRLLAINPQQNSAQPVEDIFGPIVAPPGVELFNQNAGPSGIGLILFVSNLIQIATVIAGVLVFFNFIIAGYQFITAGDGKAMEKVRGRITWSVIGLILIVASYTIAAVIGLLFFGDASFILNPEITGPEQTLPPNQSPNMDVNIPNGSDIVLPI